MPPGLVAPAEALEGLAQAEVAVGGRGVDLDELRERLGRLGDAPAVVVGASERLHDRALAGLQPAGSFQDDRRLRVVAPCQERRAALQQAVGRLAFGQRAEERGLIRPGPIGVIGLCVRVGLPGAVVGHWCGGIVVRSHPRLS